MANTYTTKLELAKPANGDVDWHIPINQNFDDIDEKLGQLYTDIEDTETELTVKKDIDMSSNDINNVGVLMAEKIKTTSYLWTVDPGLVKPRYTDNTVCYNTTTSWVTVKTTPAAKIGVLGTATIYYDISANNNGGSVRLLKNDVVVPNSEISVYSSGFLAIDVPITTGDIFKLQMTSTNYNYTCYNNVFGIYALMTPIVDESETWS